MFRIGTGYDVHRLVDKRPLILGGVEIPFEQGLEGHSDADVLIHSLMDAVLGALSLGDIGTHFPDSDPVFRDISSLELLTRVVVLMQERNYMVVNMDSVVIAQRPRLQPYREQIKQELSYFLSTALENINVKATTTEGLDSAGEGKSIAAHSVVLLKQIR